MEVVGKVIVTLVCRGREYDVELPADVKLGRLKPCIALALEHKGLHPPEGFRLSGNGRGLEEEETLLEAGIWDGSYLEVL